MNPEQRKVLTNATQVFEVMEQVRARDNSFLGTMHWKRINNREYLYRGYSGGRTKSLGRRSAETEKVKERYEAARAEHKARRAQLEEQLRVHAGYIRVNRLNRFPTVAARVIREFEKQGTPIKVVGTSAFFAYEVLAGVLFLPEFLATDDLDLLIDARQRLKIVSSLKARTLLSVLKGADPGFRRVTGSPYEFAAANADGYRVDFITQEAPDIAKPNEFFESLSADDLRPQGIGSLKWLVSAPSIREVVFDQKSQPVRLCTVDPRAFAIHKQYVGAVERGRPIKAKKDLMQAQMLVHLLSTELSHIPLSDGIRRLFPKDHRP
ncbi:MAG: GSU2403 family nucleotidyltransferase fold protein [Polyangia bacterium]